MSNPIRWETKGGHVRWQPVRYDGSVLIRICGPYGCFTKWHPASSVQMSNSGPVVYWWKWIARIRGSVGAFWERRRLSREWVSE